MRKSKKSKAITQQNIEESRDEILSKGKKFRYPFQYSKHRLVIITILISIVAVVLFGLFGWFQLYKAQNTSDVMFRFAKAFGLPVAKIDGVKVNYSDYLMLYRSSVKSIERQQGKMDDSEDSKRMKEYYKRQALSDAENSSYAMAKLEELGQKVTDEEIDAVIRDHKIIDGEERSDAAFEGIIRDNFGLNMGEYRRMISLSLAKKKYSEIIDTRAIALAEDIEKTLKTEKDWGKINQKYKENDIFSFESLSEMVDSNNLDSGRAAMATSLAKVGDVSGRFTSKSGDGFYFVRLTAREEKKVKYDSIWVRFTKLDEVLDKIRAEDKVEEYIELKTEEYENVDVD